MKKIAFPVDKGVLCEVFEQSNQFKIYTIKNKKVIDEKLLDTPHHQSGLFPFWLYMSGVADVIASRIKDITISKFNYLKINVFVGVEIKDSKSLVNEFMEGNIETNAELCEK